MNESIPLIDTDVIHCNKTSNFDWYSPVLKYRYSSRKRLTTSISCCIYCENSIVMSSNLLISSVENFSFSKINAETKETLNLYF